MGLKMHMRTDQWGSAMFPLAAFGTSLTLAGLRRGLEELVVKGIVKKRLLMLSRAHAGFFGWNFGLPVELLGFRVLLAACARWALEILDFGGVMGRPLYNTLSESPT